MKKVLILDGDTIAYRCSAAGEERFINVLHKPTGMQKVFKHRTAFNQHMLNRNKVITDDYIIEDKQEPEPVSHVLRTVKSHIDRIVKEVKPDELVIYAGESKNFRLDLPLPHGKRYKGQRGAVLRPVHLEAAKFYLRENYGAKAAVGCEVDDMCSIAAYDALRAGDKPIMFFYEKDQFQLDGVTLLYDDLHFTYQLVPRLGELRIEKTAIKGLGLKFLAYQWICSDPVDNYCAYDLSKVRFGPKTAYAVLADCKTEQEVLEAVKLQFQKFYPEEFEYNDWAGKANKADWFSMMQMYYKCCRMMRSVDDKLDCVDLFNKYGVDL